ncbi:MAG: hypothetical protein Q7S23_00280 [bacterium]|nr:hypothetical protein [bacterium]
MQWILLLTMVAVVCGAGAANLWRPNLVCRYMAAVWPALLPLTLAAWAYHAVSSIQPKDYSYVPWPYLWIWPAIWLALAAVTMFARLHPVFSAWLANKIGTWIRVGVPWRFWGPHNQPFWCLVWVTLVSILLTALQFTGSRTAAQPTHQQLGNQVVTTIRTSGNFVDTLFVEAMGQSPTPARTFATPASMVSAPDHGPYPFRWWWLMAALLGIVLTPISGVLVYWDDLVDHLRGALEVLRLRKGEAEATPAESETPGAEMARRHGAVAPMAPSHGLGWGYWFKHIVANFAPDWLVGKFFHTQK